MNESWWYTVDRQTHLYKLDTSAMKEAMKTFMHNICIERVLFAKAGL